MADVEKGFREFLKSKYAEGREGWFLEQIVPYVLAAQTVASWLAEYLHILPIEEPAAFNTNLTS